MACQSWLASVFTVNTRIITASPEKLTIKYNSPRFSTNLLDTLQACSRDKLGNSNLPNFLFRPWKTFYGIL